MMGERAVRITANAMSSTIVSSAFLTTAKVMGSTFRWVMIAPFNSFDRRDDTAHLVGAHAPARRNDNGGVGTFEDHGARDGLVELRARQDRRIDPARLTIEVDASRGRRRFELRCSGTADIVEIERAGGDAARE